MTRATAIAVTAVTCAIIAVLAVVSRLIENDRQELVARFSSERQRQLDEATREIGADFDDIADTLRFAGQLVEAADSGADRERELGALITVVRHYRMVRVFDANGTPMLTVADASWRAGVPQSIFDAFLAEVTTQAAKRVPGEVETSGRLAGDPTGWIRAFATPLPSGAGTIAIVVDVEPLFRPLRLLSAQRGTRLLVLGANGQPVPLTDVQVAQVVDSSPLDARGTAALLTSMRAGDGGIATIDRDEAIRLQLGNEEAVAAFGPVPLPGGTHWSLATLSGTSGLRANERALFWRLGLGAGAIILCLLMFGTYVVLAERRAATARERLRQAAEMERLQAQLLRAEKMATVGVLAAGIAHEVGTPLGVVRARAEIMAERLGQEHAYAGSLGVIIAQIDRVARTIRQLLNFSRAQQPAVQAVDVGQAARAVQELLAWESERRGVSIDVDVPAGLPRLAADPDQLQQALLNLVMNGLDACAPAGHVELTARLEDDDAGSRPRAVRIRVVDSGCGVPTELRHQIFDPFFTTKKRGQGTGLGLTMTARIVESHAGVLELDSVEGHGTTVTLRWPVAQARQLPHSHVEALH
jgi:signal transduction histidine kinase